MIIQYPLSESKRARIMEKSKQAMARRMLIKKRTGPEVEQANRWWALWMSALGVRKDGPVPALLPRRVGLVAILLIAHLTAYGHDADGLCGLVQALDGQQACPGTL